MATGPYYLTTPLLTSYHQQLWLIAQIVTENKDGNLIYQHPLLNYWLFQRTYVLTDESFEKKFHVTVVMEGIDEDENHADKLVISDHTHNR